MKYKTEVISIGVLLAAFMIHLSCRYGTEKVHPERNFEFPKHFSPLNGLSVDEEGNSFVRTYEKTKECNGYYYDIFDSEGYFITRVLLKAAPELPMAWKKSKLYTIKEDEERFQTIKRYKVIWKY